MGAGSIQSDSDVTTVAPEHRHLLMADRGDRFNAAAVDWAIDWFVLCFSSGVTDALLGSPSREGHPSTITGWISVAAIGALWIAQMVLLVRRGQSIGKIVCEVRVVDAGGTSAVGFVRIVLLRAMTPLALAGGLQWLAVSAGWSVPGTPELADWIWVLVLAVDSLWIFGPERRCLHDYLAGTRVVRWSRKADQRHSLAARG